MLLAFLISFWHWVVNATQRRNIYDVPMIHSANGKQNEYCESVATVFPNKGELRETLIATDRPLTIHFRSTGAVRKSWSDFALLSDNLSKSIRTTRFSTEVHSDCVPLILKERNIDNFTTNARDYRDEILWAADYRYLRFLSFSHFMLALPFQLFACSKREYASI